MIVAYEHCVDVWQIIDPHTSFPRRLGPNQDTGLARSDQIGSIKMLDLRCCMRTVEWFISVIRNSPPSVRRAGADC
jgi:hypothetical protein